MKKRLRLRSKNKASKSRAVSTKASLKQKFNNRTMTWNFRKITSVLTVFTLILGISSVWVWYGQLYMTSERRFWMAVENSMSTPSVVRTLSQGGTGNQVIQNFRFNFSPQQVIENAVTYSEKSATVDTSVRTEGRVYTDEQYLRYTNFETNETSEISGVIDSIIGQWAKDAAPDSEEGRLSYLSEQVSLVIFANMPSNLRAELLSELRNQNVYGNTSLSIEEEIDGDDVLTYTVPVKLKSYAAILNQSFEKLGYGDFPALSPENYREEATVNATMSVRKRDNTFVRVAFGGREEVYSNYGVSKTVEKPEATLDISELQERVQSAIQ